jgi:hypothetical protein
MTRKLLAVGIVGALVGVGGAVALAAAPRPVARTAALGAGSPAHPQGVRLAVNFGWQGLGLDVTSFQLWFPQGSVYNGARYPTCSVQTLNRVGPSGCPKGSIMGTGTGTALADTTITRPTITVVNCGASAVYFYTVLNNPARVQEPGVGHITRLGGNFSYHLSATIPQNLRVVAGVPIRLTSLQISAGRGNWLALTSPPAGIKVLTGFSNGATTGYLVWVQNT